MRKDIQTSVDTNDMVFYVTNKYTVSETRVVDNPTGLSRYVYLEADVTSDNTDQRIFDDGMFVRIPYTPIYKEIMLRVKKLGDGESYVRNPVDGTDWFLVKVAPCGKGLQNAYLSRLMEIAENDYYLQFNDGEVRIYAASNMDCNITECDKQNANLLLSCVPSNNYRYPISGVGLIRWVNGNAALYSLTETLMREFEEDGMPVKEASWNENSKELYINATSYD